MELKQILRKDVSAGHVECFFRESDVAGLLVELGPWIRIRNVDLNVNRLVGPHLVIKLPFRLLARLLSEHQFAVEINLDFFVRLQRVGHCVDGAFFINRHLQRVQYRACLIEPHLSDHDSRPVFLLVSEERVKLFRNVRVIEEDHAGRTMQASEVRIPIHNQL